MGSMSGFLLGVIVGAAVGVATGRVYERASQAWGVVRGARVVASARSREAAGLVVACVLLVVLAAVAFLVTER